MPLKKRAIYYGEAVHSLTGDDLVLEGAEGPSQLVVTVWRDWIWNC